MFLLIKDTVWKKNPIEFSAQADNIFEFPRCQIQNIIFVTMKSGFMNEVVAYEFFVKGFNPFILIEQVIYVEFHYAIVTIHKYRMSLLF